MKTVWIINHYACKPDEGAGSRHYDIAKTLSCKGVRVRLFAASYNHFSKNERIQISGQKQWVESINCHFDIVWLKTNFSYSGNGIKRLLNMFSFFFRVLRFAGQDEKPDVVIGSSVHLLAPLAGYYVAKRYRAGFITEIRDIWPLTLVELGEIKNYHPMVLFFSWIETFVYVKADAIIATMPGFDVYLNNRKIEKPVFWIPNGYAVPSNNGLDKTEVDIFKYARAAHECICIYAGSHGISNNLDVLVDAALILKDYKELGFVFIGDGPEKERLIKRAEKESLSNVYFLNRVPKANLRYILGQCDIGLAALPDSVLYRYGISLNKLNDYLYNECPVVLSGDSPNNPVLLSECGVCVPPNDSGRMAEAILTQWRCGIDERKRMGRKGKEHIIREHSIEALSEKYMEAIAYVMGEGKK